MSPATKTIHEPVPIRSVLRVGTLPGIAYAFPNFNIKDVLTPVGEQRVNLIMNVGGCRATSLILLMDGQPLLQSNWAEKDLASVSAVEIDNKVSKPRSIS